MPSSEVPYESYLHLIRQLDELVEVFENHPDPATRDQVVSLLTGLDMLHHEALGRLLARLRGAGIGEVLDRALEDPVVHTLLGLYGLAELELPEEPAARPSPRSAFVPLERLTVNGKPLRPKASWVEIARMDELPPDSARVAHADGVPVLLVHLQGGVHAFRDQCPECRQPLSGGLLEGVDLVCPARGCRFDARTGRRTDAGEGRLQVLPVAVRGASVALAREGGRAAGEGGGDGPDRGIG